MKKPKSCEEMCNMDYTQVCVFQSVAPNKFSGMAGIDCQQIAFRQLEPPVFKPFIEIDMSYSLFALSRFLTYRISKHNKGLFYSTKVSVGCFFFLT